MTLSVIITNCGQAREIREMLLPVAEHVSNIDGEISNDFEIIVVDDASNDQGLDELEFFLDDAFANARVVRCETKRYTGGARNIGTEHARGDWLWFVDGDDKIVPDAIGRIIRRSKEVEGFDCMVLDYEIDRADGSSHVVFHESSNDFRVWDVGIMCWFKVIRRTSFIPFRRDLSEDNDWWIRECMSLVKTCGGRFATVPGGPCYIYGDKQPGSFMCALERFRSALCPRDAVEALYNRDTASAVAAVLRMLSEMALLAPEMRAERMPEAFLDSFEWTLKWWIEHARKLATKK